MDKTKWVRRWNTWIQPTRHSGVYKRKEGGHLVRARVKDATTGQLKEIKKVLPEATEIEALNFLEQERSRIRAGLVLAKPRKPRFCDYAVSLFEKKLAKGQIKSSAGRDRWRFTLEHLIAGTTSSDGETVVPGLGEYYVDELRPDHVEQWVDGIAGLIRAGDYSPHTANGWLSILRVIVKAATYDLELGRVVTDGIGDFDTSEHVTYPEEAPNSLEPNQVPLFLEALRDQFPQHYAMAYLGLVTGLRPSSLRPLRRRGDTPDVQWERGRLLIRRSQTRGNHVMQTTKQKVRYRIELPEAAMEVLKWHVDTQLVTREQEASDLLFPSVTGGFRAPTVLNKPFAAVSEAIGLGYSFTQRGMRRTFNDLCRAAEVESLVTRSISGHMTERMHHHYSTVRPEEQREGIARVIDLMSVRADRAGATSGGAQGGAQSG